MLGLTVAHLPGVTPLEPLYLQEIALLARHYVSKESTSRATYDGQRRTSWRVLETRLTAGIGNCVSLEERSSLTQSPPSEGGDSHSRTPPRRCIDYFLGLWAPAHLSKTATETSERLSASGKQELSVGELLNFRRRPVVYYALVSVSNSVVESLLSPWFGTRRVVVADSYFASYECATRLNEKGLRFIGFVNLTTVRLEDGDAEVPNEGTEGAPLSRGHTPRTPIFLALQLAGRRKWESWVCQDDPEVWAVV